RAAAAHRAALAAAVQHAAATAALRTVEREVTATSQRLRAIEDRWIPRLRTTLAEVELALDELEHADAARLRRAMAAQADTIGRQP
ncbi:MAG TPA: V-type ATP synthase subunit D, partial [Actinomycetes bacterium]|nr:V-type ATP synthase subunit D [Actinomycetes bacterium]